MNVTVEEIRARLLSDDRIQYLIQQRAYEIWILRGRQHGRADEDWRLAENEVVGFLIEEELRRSADAALPASDIIEVTEIAVVSTPLDITPQLIPEADLIITSEPTIAPEIPAGNVKMKKTATSTAKKSTTKAAKAVTEKPKKRATIAASKSPAKKTSKPKAAKSDQTTLD